MAITVIRNLKGQEQLLYAKIKNIWGNKSALWVKVGFFWNQDSADDTKIDHELDVVEIPFSPNFNSDLNLWEQAYSSIKIRLEAMGYKIVDNI